MRKTLLLATLGLLTLLALLVTGGCWHNGTTPQEEATEETVVDDGKGEQIYEASTTPEVTPYFQEGDLEFHAIEALSDSEVMTEELKAAVTKANNDANGATGTEYALEWDQVEPLYNWYSVATVKEGSDAYAGWTLLVMHLRCSGMCFSEDIYRFVWNEASGEKIFLPQYSSEYQPEHLLPVLEKEDEQVTFQGLILPETIDLPGVYAENASAKVLVKAIPDQMFLLQGDPEMMFEDPMVGKVYAAGGSCFYVQSADGSVARYEYDPGFGFVSEDKESVEEVMMTWTATGEETNLTTDYSYTPSGCGMTGNCYNMVDAELAHLMPVATASNGVEFYAVSDPKEGASVAGGDTLEQEMLANNYAAYKATNQWRVQDEGVTLLTFEEYVDEQSVVFWRDPFGRWSTLTKNDYKPVAECGKPVIYLYPTATTDVSVQVGIDEITVSEPAYGVNGWTVRATPDGELTNHADGQTYPYLFWEGRSYSGIASAQGFMVARRNIPSFIEEALMEMGLNETERADFMEFWVPRMLDNPEPYFYVTFLGTQAFNKIAPLTITPKPTTLIRVFMAYEPTSTPFEVQAQELRSIPRRGFTVVEWGGTSSRPW